MKISFIIPTFNEHENIIRLINLINKITRRINVHNEIIIVDDNSTDGTIQEVQSLQKNQDNLKLIIRKKRLGVGSAHIVGYTLAKYDVIISMDADLSHSPEKIPEFLRLIEEGYELVIGSRYIPNGKTDKSLFNKIMSKMGGIFLSKTLRINVKDLSTGYRAFKKNVWEKIKNLNYSSGNVFLIESLYYAYINNVKIAEIPIHFRKRRLGKSKTPMLKESFKALIFPLKIKIFRRKL